MNLIGVCRSTARFVSLALTLLAPCFGLECEPGLNATERVAKFKELDQQAESAMRAHHPEQAVTLYRQAVCLIPNSARGLYGLGVAEAAVQHFPEALQALQTADSILPTTPMPLIMQAHVNVSLQDTNALKKNLRDAAARFPTDAGTHQTLARFLAEQNLMVLALAEALRAEQASGGDVNARIQLAGLENAAGAYRDAIRHALAAEDTAGATNESRAGAAGIAGLSFESVGDQDHAIEQLEKAIQFDPGRENSYLALANLFDQLQRPEEAVRVLREAHAKLPKSSAVLLPLGADLVQTGKYSEGAALLREVLRRDAQASEAYIGLADAARRTGEPKQEVEALENLTRLKPDYPMIHVLLARALMTREPVDYRQVLDELTLAEKQSASDPDVYSLRGKCLFAMGKYEEAVGPLQHAIELRALDPASRYQLGRVYQKLGKAELAREQFESVKFLESIGRK